MKNARWSLTVLTLLLAAASPPVAQGQLYREPLPGQPAPCPATTVRPSDPFFGTLEGTSDSTTDGTQELAFESWERIFVKSRSDLTRMVHVDVEANVIYGTGLWEIEAGLDIDWRRFTDVHEESLLYVFRFDRMYNPEKVLDLIFDDRAQALLDQARTDPAARAEFVATYGTEFVSAVRKGLSAVVIVEASAFTSITAEDLRVAVDVAWEGPNFGGDVDTEYEQAIELLTQQAEVRITVRQQGGESFVGIDGLTSVDVEDLHNVAEIVESHIANTFDYSNAVILQFATSPIPGLYADGEENAEVELLEAKREKGLQILDQLFHTQPFFEYYSLFLDQQLVLDIFGQANPFAHAEVLRRYWEYVAYYSALEQARNRVRSASTLPMVSRVEIPDRHHWITISGGKIPGLRGGFEDADFETLMLLGFFRALPSASQKMADGLARAIGFSFDTIPGDAERRAIQDLDLRDSTLSDLDMLRFFPRLRCLNLSSNPAIRHLNSLSHLDDKLEDLSIADTGVTSLRPLEGFQRLSRLDMSRTDIDEIRHISGLPLVDFVAQETPILDLDDLYGMILLENVDVHASQVASMHGLAASPLLQRLNIGQTQICYLGTHEGYHHIKQLFKGISENWRGADWQTHPDWAEFTSRFAYYHPGESTDQFSPGYHGFLKWIRTGHEDRTDLTPEEIDQLIWDLKDHWIFHSAHVSWMY